MLNLGFGEILFIAVLALLLIGPKQLPEVARTLGRFLNELKRSAGQLSDEFKNHASNQTIKLQDIDDQPGNPSKASELKAQSQAPATDSASSKKEGETT